MPPNNPEAPTHSGAHAIGRQMRTEWESTASTSRNAALVVIAIGFLLIAAAMVVQAIHIRTNTIILTGLACLVVGWLVLVGRGARFMRRVRRLDATARAHRQAQLAGNCEAALRQSEHLLALLPSGIALWWFVNRIVEASVTAGRYAEALAVTARWSDAAQARGAHLDPDSWALVEINLAEAEYCAGRIDAARQRMDRLQRQIEEKSGPFDGNPVSAIVVNGTATQRAWIAALHGEPCQSLRLLDGVDPQGIPEEYRSEIHYTRAFALSGTGDHQAAEKAAREGAALATRASSVRNGIFLLGTLACAREDFQTAVGYFEVGAGHSYRAQGGDALLSWSRALRRLGRAEQAEQVAQLVLERDPQSAAAASKLRAPR
jgi:tetratricopeptide (TPR) repeat protein